MAQKDDKWEEWGLEELVDNLRKYTDRNPLPNEMGGKTPKHSGGTQGADRRRDNLMMTASGSGLPQTSSACVYCSSSDHRSKDCTKILNSASRREILKRNKLCYNCTKSSHMAAQCRSRGCGKCSGRHHTSLCDKVSTTLPPEQATEQKRPTDRFYGALEVQTTLHATVIAKINGVQARVMLDTRAGSSYISSSLLTKLNLKPDRVERRVIEQMYGTVDKKLELYKVILESNTVNTFNMELQVINAEKPVLTNLPNPRIADQKNKHNHIKRLVVSEETANQDKLPVHIILGAADVQRIKSTEPPVLGPNPDTDPGAKFTMLGWVLAGKAISPTTESENKYNHIKRLFFSEETQPRINYPCTSSLERLMYSE